MGQFFASLTSNRGRINIKWMSRVHSKQSEIEISRCQYFISIFQFPGKLQFPPPTKNTAFHKAYENNGFPKITLGTTHTCLSLSLSWRNVLLGTVHFPSPSFVSHLHLPFPQDHQKSLLFTWHNKNSQFVTSDQQLTLK